MSLAEDKTKKKKKAVAKKSSKKKPAKKKPAKKSAKKKVGTKASGKATFVLAGSASFTQFRAKRTPLTASDIFTPRLKSNIAVYQVVETIRRLKKINEDYSKIPVKTAKKYAAKKR